jgi:hypothetical protein
MDLQLVTAQQYEYRKAIMKGQVDEEVVTHEPGVKMQYDPTAAQLRLLRLNLGNLGLSVFDENNQQ